MLATGLLALAAGAQAKTTLAPLKALHHKGARVGALVVELGDGKVLASFHPDKTLVPASTSKLYVTAAALAHWGNDHRFETRFLAAGPIVDGTLHGNLVFAGAGDPGFTNQTLATLVRRLKASGLERVSGKLIVNAGYFGPIECVPADRCQAKRSSHNSYDAGLSSAAINFSNTAVAVTPAPHAGSAAEVRQLPYPLAGFNIHNDVTTTSHGRSAITLSRTTQDNRGRLTVSGRIPVGHSTRRDYVAVGRPNHYAGALIRAFLDASDIRVDGPTETSRHWPPRGHAVASVKSQPLWMQLRRMLVWSNNFMADTFALDLLREHTPPPLSLTTAGALVARFGCKLEKQSSLMGEHAPQLELASGSGLTAANRASARDLAALLDTMYHHPGRFPGFLGTLTVPAHTPVGMLKDADNQWWMRRLAVKSGSFHGRFKVFALAGYMRFADGGWGVFAVLVNGTDQYQPSVPTAIAATRRALTPFLQTRHP